jgi:hypothetical protein
MKWKVRDITKCISSTSETFINYVISFACPSFFGESFQCSWNLRESIWRDNIGLYIFPATTPLGL